jgi:D-alanyl-D-alanine carboxypeptidase (penicillin-binding protein 5/6)
MTALILYENNELSDLVSISYPASYNFEGKVAYLTDGVEISVEQLLEFLLVYSANDSAYATAMHISNSVDEFVKLMNTRAKKLNMMNTNFQNPDGLDQENHYTTINDLLLLSEYILRNTKLIDITNKSKFYYEQNGEVKEYENTNLILKNGFKGLKTGWTSRAGLTFIGYNQENNRNILTIVNKSYVDDNKVKHFDDTLFLYKETLANFQEHLLLSKTEYVYKIINSSESTLYSYNYDIFKFGNINISKDINLKSIDSSEFLLENYFDDKSIKINLFKSKKSIQYNFLMSNTITKLLFSS